MTLVTHPWPPIEDEHSTILILGTMPSPANAKPFTKKLVEWNRVIREVTNVEA